MWIKKARKDSLPSVQLTAAAIKASTPHLPDPAPSDDEKNSHKRPSNDEDGD